VIRPKANPAFPAQTYVRAAYKAFQSGLPFVCEGVVSPTNGVLYRSRAVKIAEMGTWGPFNSLQLKPVGNNEFKLFPCAPRNAAAPRNASDYDTMEFKRDPDHPAGTFGPMLDDWREIARVRAKAAVLANPDRDFWKIAKWLERKYHLEQQSKTRVEAEAHQGRPACSSGCKHV
jgi:hypothetical protein